MNEYFVAKADTEQTYLVAANAQAGEKVNAFNPTIKKKMLERFQDVDELVGRIEVKIAVAA